MAFQCGESIKELFEALLIVILSRGSVNPSFGLVATYQSISTTWAEHAEADSGNQKCQCKTGVYKQNVIFFTYLLLTHTGHTHKS